MAKKEAYKAAIKLLDGQLKQAQKDIADAHELLNEMRVPTNGIDANGKLGRGKREDLTLEQRLTYVKLDEELYPR